MRKRLTIAMVLVLVVAGAVAAQGADIFGGPQSSSTEGVPGNGLRTWDRRDRQMYVTGAVDMLAAIVLEMDAIDEFPEGVFPEEISQAQWVLLTGDERTALAFGITLGRVASAAAIPQGVTYPQILALVDNYLSSHPSELHNNAALLIWRALADAEWK